MHLWLLLAWQSKIDVSPLEQLTLFKINAKARKSTKLHFIFVCFISLKSNISWMPWKETDQVLKYCMLHMRIAVAHSIFIVFRSFQLFLFSSHIRERESGKPSLVRFTYATTEMSHSFRYSEFPSIHILWRIIVIYTYSHAQSFRREERSKYICIYIIRFLRQNLRFFIFYFGFLLWIWLCFRSAICFAWKWTTHTNLLASLVCHLPYSTSWIESAWFIYTKSGLQTQKYSFFAVFSSFLYCSLLFLYLFYYLNTDEMRCKQIHNVFIVLCRNEAKGHLYRPLSTMFPLSVSRCDAIDAHTVYRSVDRLIVVKQCISHNFFDRIKSRNLQDTFIHPSIHSFIHDNLFKMNRDDKIERLKLAHVNK